MITFTKEDYYDVASERLRRDVEEIFLVHALTGDVTFRINEDFCNLIIHYNGLSILRIASNPEFTQFQITNRNNKINLPNRKTFKDRNSLYAALKEINMQLADW